MKPKCCLFLLLVVIYGNECKPQNGTKAIGASDSTSSNGFRKTGKLTAHHKFLPRHPAIKHEIVPCDPRLHVMVQRLFGHLVKASHARPKPLHGNQAEIEYGRPVSVVVRRKVNRKRTTTTTEEPTTVRRIMKKRTKTTVPTSTTKVTTTTKKSTSITVKPFTTTSTTPKYTTTTKKSSASTTTTKNLSASTTTSRPATTTNKPVTTSGTTNKPATTTTTLRSTPSATTTTTLRTTTTSTTKTPTTQPPTTTKVPSSTMMAPTTQAPLTTTTAASSTKMTSTTSTGTTQKPLLTTTSKPDDPSDSIEGSLGNDYDNYGDATLAKPSTTTGRPVTTASSTTATSTKTTPTTSVGTTLKPMPADYDYLGFDFGLDYSDSSSESQDVDSTSAKPSTTTGRPATTTIISSSTSLTPSPVTSTTATSIKTTPTTILPSTTPSIGTTKQPLSTTTSKAADYDYLGFDFGGDSNAGSQGDVSYNYDNYVDATSAKALTTTMRPATTTSTTVTSTKMTPTTVLPATTPSTGTTQKSPSTTTSKSGDYDYLGFDFGDSNSGSQGDVSYNYDNYGDTASSKASTTTARPATVTTTTTTSTKPGPTTVLPSSTTAAGTTQKTLSTTTSKSADYDYLGFDFGDSNPGSQGDVSYNYDNYGDTVSAKASTTTVRPVTTKPTGPVTITVPTSTTTEFPSYDYNFESAASEKRIPGSESSVGDYKDYLDFPVDIKPMATTVSPSPMVTIKAGTTTVDTVTKNDDYGINWSHLSEDLDLDMQGDDPKADPDDSKKVVEQKPAKSVDPTVPAGLEKMVESQKVINESTTVASGKSTSPPTKVAKDGSEECSKEGSHRSHRHGHGKKKRGGKKRDKDNSSEERGRGKGRHHG